MEAKYRVVVLGCLKKLNTEEEVVEEYVNYLSTIVAKRQVMSFSVLYEEGGNRGAIVATGRQISEYLLECYERSGMDDFFLIVSLKNKNVFFIGIFKNSEKEVIKKEIFNIFIFNEILYIEELKRKKLPVVDLFSMRNNYAEQMRNSKFYKNTEKAIFIK